MKKNINKKLGKIILRHRKEKKITQNYIAKCLKMDQANYSRHERGILVIDICFFIDVCKIIKVDPIDILKELLNRG